MKRQRSSPEFYTARTRAGNAVSQAKKRGELPYLRQVYVKCTDCDARATEHDHRDYDKPLDVQPVCHSCNLRRGRAKWTPQDMRDRRLNTTRDLPQLGKRLELNEGRAS